MFVTYCQSDKLVVVLKIKLNTQQETATKAQDFINYVTNEHDHIKESEKH